MLFDEEIEEMVNVCIEDGEWNPESPTVQIGSGEETQPGPSQHPDPPRRLEYTMRKKSERTYAKNAAVDRVYEVKIDEQYRGERLENVRQGLHDMLRRCWTKRGDI